MDALGLTGQDMPAAGKARAARPPIPGVVAQHVDDAAVLRNARRVLVAAPHARLHHLARLDERLAAHLDGIAVAGDAGSRLARAALASPQAGELFVAAVGLIEQGDTAGLHNLFALAAAVPAARAGLLSAFGWVSAHKLEGIIAGLLGDDRPLQQIAGLAACAMHRVDPGAALARLVASPDADVRARALRCIGESGRLDLLGLCLRRLDDAAPACAFHAAWSAVLLGDRGEALLRLRRAARLTGARALEGDVPPSRQDAALDCALKVLPMHDARVLLREIPPAQPHRLIHAIGMAGDPLFCPWLICRMQEPAFARLAGEAFSWITGIDLAAHGLDRRPPDRVPAGPNDDPADDRVAMDPDDGLPWPEPHKLADWWGAHRAQFPPGVRSFMGAPPGALHCAAVLREGGQRQRAAAAAYLCLLHPGTPLFPTRAPAWRQQRWLTAGVPE